MLQTFECIRNLIKPKESVLFFSSSRNYQSVADGGCYQCLPASLVTKMSVALYLFSSRDLVFIGSGLKICENCD